MYKIFSGSANTALSFEVAKLLNTQIAKSKVVRFGNSEVKVTITEDVKDQTCFVIQPTANPTDTHLMELFFFCDALKRQEAKKVIAIIPYFGYARQNIQHQPGESVSANVVVRFLETIGFSEVWTIDLHDEATEGIFSIPFKNLSALPLLAAKIKEELNNNLSNVIVVSPDQGGVERSRKFADNFYDKKGVATAIVEKKRDLTKIHESKTVELFGDVAGKDVVIVDDIVTSGGTLINAANLCLEKGAKKVYAAIVHHDFTVDAPQKIQNSKIEKFFTTNTIVLNHNQKFQKLKAISVSPLITTKIKDYL